MKLGITPIIKKLFKLFIKKYFLNRLWSCQSRIREYIVYLNIISPVSRAGHFQLFQKLPIEELIII